MNDKGVTPATPGLLNTYELCYFDTYLNWTTVLILNRFRLIDGRNGQRSKSRTTLCKYSKPKNNLGIKQLGQNCGQSSFLIFTQLSFLPGNS